MAVIGDPISHSLSPLIHETALCALGINCDYQKIFVQRGHLKEFFDNPNTKKLTGFNVTMPHKTDIIKYLDYVSPEALNYNAVNTVKVKNGKFYGYNTDADGFVRSANDIGFDFGSKRIVILGAGGVSSTLCIKLSEIAAGIKIVNRHIKGAEEIAKRLSSSSASIECEELIEERLFEICNESDVLINATPLGMSGIDSDYKDFRFLSGLKSNALVADLIYNPPKTRLLAHAEALGLKTINGFGMLVYQGLIADEIFLEKTFDFRPLYKKICDIAEKIKK